MKRMTKAFVVFLLTLAMLVGLMPGMSMTARAETTYTYEIVTTMLCAL